MATERQIAANRRNARKSTGPRSRAGKRRASRNSYRHGFSYGVAAVAEFTKHVEALAQKIAGRAADAVTLEIARSIARAELDLAQIRRTKVAVIARMYVTRFLTSIDRGLPLSLTVPVAPSMPSSELERSAEAVRRALPELLKLDRYERRATARRDRASRQIIARKMLLDNF